MAGVNILKFIKEDYHHDANLILSNKTNILKYGGLKKVCIKN